MMMDRHSDLVSNLEGVVHNSGAVQQSDKMASELEAFETRVCCRCTMMTETLGISSIQCYWWARLHAFTSADNSSVYPRRKQRWAFTTTT
jgi:hypothetical protein